MIPLKKIQEAILAVGGRQGRECYRLLYTALDEAVCQYPWVPLMKELWAVVKREAGKKTAAAVSEALERAVADLWENGEREILASYQRGWG